MIIPGSDYLSKILHAAAQSLLIPDIPVLLLLLLMSLMEFGAFIAEIKRRRAFHLGDYTEIFKEIEGAAHRNGKHLQQVIDNSQMSAQRKTRLTELLSNERLSVDDKTLAAKDILNKEELEAKRILAKTDLIAKLGPTLGLMGTIIPLGPGLVALGKGDVQALSSAMTVAFDTTVIGVAAGAIATLISIFRHRWYEKELMTLELLLEAIIGGEDGEDDKTDTVRRIEIEDKSLINR